MKQPITPFEATTDSLSELLIGTVLTNFPHKESCSRVELGLQTRGNVLRRPVSLRVFCHGCSGGVEFPSLSDLLHTWNRRTDAPVSELVTTIDIEASIESKP